MSPPATILKAYFLWMLGGICGVHHVYLGRPKQALIWSLSLGLFLVGWLRDFVRIPAYVRECNAARECNSATKKEIVTAAAFSLQHWVAQLAFGSFLGWIGLLLIPVDKAASLDNITRATLGSVVNDPCGIPAMAMFVFGVVVGVWVVGSVGSNHVSFISGVKGAAIGLALVALSTREVFGAPEDPWERVQISTAHELVAFAAATMSARSRMVSQPRGILGPKSPLHLRILVFYTVVTFMLTALVWASYENGWWPGDKDEATGIKGPPSRVKHNVKEKLKAGMKGLGIDADADLDSLKQQLHRELGRVYAIIQAQGGAYGIFAQMMSSLDSAVNSEARALAVLGLDSSATNKDIKRAFRKASLAVHPDKMLHATEEEKATAEAEFIKLKEAYELLTNSPSSGK